MKAASPRFDSSVRTWASAAVRCVGVTAVGLLVVVGALLAVVEAPAAAVATKKRGRLNCVRCGMVGGGQGDLDIHCKGTILFYAFSFVSTYLDDAQDDDDDGSKTRRALSPIKAATWCCCRASPSGGRKKPA